MPVIHFDWTLDKVNSSKHWAAVNDFMPCIIKYIKNGPPVYYTGLDEPSHAPKFEWQDNTKK